MSAPHATGAAATAAQVDRLVEETGDAALMARHAARRAEALAARTAREAAQAPEVPERRQDCARCQAAGRPVVYTQYFYAGRWAPEVCPACIVEEREGERARAADLPQIEGTERERLVARRLEELALPARYVDATIEGVLLFPDAPNVALLKRKQAFARGYVDKWPKRRANARFPQIVVMRGGFGTQKTYLAAAVARALVERYAIRALWRTLPRLVRDVRAAWGGRGGAAGASEEERLARYVEADLLVIDEVSQHALHGQPTQLLYDVVAERDAQLRPTILTTNESDEGFNKLVGGALLSRSSQAGAWEFGDDDVRLRIAAGALDED